MLPELSASLKDKVVIDCSNELFERLSPDYNSATEAISKIAGVKKIAKTFNTTGAGNMAKDDNHDMDMLVAGEEEAKKVAIELIKQVGFRPVDAGDIDMAHSLQEVARVWVKICIIKGNFNSYLKLVDLS